MGRSFSGRKYMKYATTTEVTKMNTKERMRAIEVEEWVRWVYNWDVEWTRTPSM